MPAARRFGLALSGGAVRGAAHLGVLEVLESEGLRPCALAGTSIGAVVGALWCGGLSARRLLSIFEPSSWRSLVSLALGGSDSLLSVDRLEQSLRSLIADRPLEDLSPPFRAVACDIDRGERVVLGHGDTVRAVLASCALPGLFPPVVLDGRRLVDGGVVDNLPVGVVQEVMKESGPGAVVAVDLLPPFTAASGPATGMIEIWQRSLYLLIRGSHPQPREVDLLIQPDIARYSFYDFSRVGELFEHGRKAAREALPALRRLLAEASPVRGVP